MRFNIFLSLSLVNVTRLHHLTCVPFSYSQTVSQWSKKLLRGFRWWRGGGEDEWWGRVVNCQSFLHSYLLFLNTRETKNSLLGTHLEGDYELHAIPSHYSSDLSSPISRLRSATVLRVLETFLFGERALWNLSLPRNKFHVADKWFHCPGQPQQGSDLV